MPIIDSFVIDKFMINEFKVWRDAGVVERGGLENRCTLTSTQGSNPCLSATTIGDIKHGQDIDAYVKLANGAIIQAHVPASDKDTDQLSIGAIVWCARSRKHSRILKD